MIGRDYAEVQCSENKVEGGGNSRTVNCLRGRLLAERMASRIAREEANKLEIRLLEVEKQLEKEGKSRNIAEKKLNFLMKKLQLINFPQSTPTSTPQEIRNLETKKEEAKSPKGPLNLEGANGYNLSSCSSSTSASNERSKSIFSAEEDSYMSCGDQLNPYEDSRMESFGEEEDVDNSMALVPMEEIPPEKKTVDREEFVGATVEQVLELLKIAKEEIQSSMERRKMSMSMSMIEVG